MQPNEESNEDEDTLTEANVPPSEEAPAESAQTSAEVLLDAFKKLRTVQWFRKPIAGYNPSDVRALTVIALTQCNTTGVKISEISNHLHIAKPSVTQILKSLESEGLIERISDDTDRRVIRVRLTEQGEAAFKSIAQARINSFRELAAFLGEEQSHQLAGLLNQVSFFFSEY